MRPRLPTGSVAPGWAAAPPSRAVVTCLAVQALTAPAISLPRRPADVISGHEITQRLSEHQSRSVCVPVTSHRTSFLFLIFAAALGLNLRHK